ncbi:MAG: hypothetical protein ACR2HH_04550 [Chthoniobacterales bacterium]
MNSNTLPNRSHWVTIARSFLILTTCLPYIPTSRGSTEILDVHNVPNPSIGNSNWEIVNSDTGTIDVVSHVAPGTPDGTYNVSLIKGTVGDNRPYFQLNVVNGAGGRYSLVGGTSGGSLGDGPPGLELETDRGEYASLVGHFLYYGTLGSTYYGSVPPVFVKTAVLDVHLGSSSPKTNDRRIGGNQKCGIHGMAGYSAYAMTASLCVEDKPISYTPPRGPAIDFKVSYSAKENQQPVTFSYSNLGPKWTFNWLSYVADDPAAGRALVAVYLPGGGSEFYPALATGQTSAPEA